MSQQIQTLSSQPEIQRLLANWPTLRESILEEACQLQSIPAPTFHEQARAEAVAVRFREIGLEEVHSDEIGNVYARTPGRMIGPSVMVSAHLDTVFPHETDLALHEKPEANRWVGPGLGDNALGLAAMIQLAEALKREGVQPASSIEWVATVGEEGMGNLRGIRAACERLEDQVGITIILEGIGLGRIYHSGLGVRRLQIAVHGAGGHSWLNADRPSAIHHLVQIASGIVQEVIPPQNPRSSLNIGVISGGTSVNTRAAEATCLIDLRSLHADALASMERSLRQVVSRFQNAPHLSVETEVVGDRPSAALPSHHPLIQAASAVLESLKVGSASREVGSTDANIPLSLGIPSVCIGITTGGGAHTTQEYIDCDPIPTGMRQLTLLTLLAAENIATWHFWEASS